MTALFRLSLAAVAGLLLLNWAPRLPGRDAAENTCRLVVTVVPDATLKVQGNPTKKTGPKREFISPPLEPGKKYFYTLVAQWSPNSYTKITRTYKIDVVAGQTAHVDMTKPNPKIRDDIRVAYVPTDEEVVDAMCKLARVGKNDVVYDLGCGDGRIVITAVKQYGAKKGVGVDIDLERIKDAKDNAKKEKVQDKVEFRKEDVFKVTDLDKATVIMLYMGEDINKQLRPTLQKLKPGTRIVSHAFGMGDWKPDKKETVDPEGDAAEIFLWTIKEKDRQPEKKN